LISVGFLVKFIHYSVIFTFIISSNDDTFINDMTVIIECISSKFEEAKGKSDPVNRGRTNNTMTTSARPKKETKSMINVRKKHKKLKSHLC
jgi:hypothetical protein